MIFYALEVLSYLFGFWLFIFSRRFRQHWIEDFKAAHWIDQIFRVIGALFSIAVDLVAPLLIVYLIFIA